MMFIEVTVNERRAMIRVDRITVIEEMVDGTHLYIDNLAFKFGTNMLFDDVIALIEMASGDPGVEGGRGDEPTQSDARRLQLGVRGETR